MKTQNNYMNPYLAGFLLGLLLLVTFVVTGRGLGASGAIKSVVVAGVETISPSHANNSEFYKEYVASHNEGVLKNWLVFEILGVIAGAFVSGLIANRLTWKVEHNPKIKSRARLIAALFGGMLFGIGAQFGRGCTSGAALSGMAVLSAGGVLTMFAIFATAYALAYIFRKLWI